MISSTTWSSKKTTWNDKDLGTRQKGRGKHVEFFISLRRKYKIIIKSWFTELERLHFGNTLGRVSCWGEQHSVLIFCTGTPLHLFFKFCQVHLETSEKSWKILPLACLSPRSKFVINTQTCLWPALASKNCRSRTDRGVRLAILAPAGRS